MQHLGTYTVRPSARSTNSETNEIFRVYISQANLQLRAIAQGRLCMLKAEEDKEYPVFVWPAVEKIQDSVIQASKSLQQLYDFKLGGKVRLVAQTKPIENATVISLTEVAPADGQSPRAQDAELSHWAWLLEPVLARQELIVPGMLLDNITARGYVKTFQVTAVNGSSAKSAYKYTPSSALAISDGERSEPDAGQKEDIITLSIRTDGTGGLDDQIKQINEELSYYHKEPSNRMPQWVRPRAGGIILYGPAGTGKTLLLRKLVGAGWPNVFNLEDEMGKHSKVGEIATAITATFAKARRSRAALVLIDNLERFAGREELASFNKTTEIVRALSRELEQLKDSRTLVVAATRSPDQIDPSLRNFSRFSIEIEVPVPTSKSRLEILRALVPRQDGTDDQQFEKLTSWLATQTHGFVGSDLCWLLQTAAKETLRRSDLLSNGVESREMPKETLHVVITDDDCRAALRKIKPTAMREIFVETPEIRWSDIGGQEEVKKTLERALIWPEKYSDEMKRYAIEPRKGLLLFGPPGCSKTMIARAAATESNYNFLTVKGAELINMYVGESERAIRELFQKARSVSPSIIFFDEIDAVGTSRDGQHHSGLNVVTTLLNEMDGIVELKGVFVLAATNRPEVLDPALTRAGRLDQMLYIGPPDFEARKQILETRLRQIDTDQDVDALTVAHETDGYSGAELVSLCRRAGEAALEDYVASGELVKVGIGHFRKAQSEIHMAITDEMVASYKMFAQGLHH